MRFLSATWLCHHAGVGKDRGKSVARHQRGELNSPWVLIWITIDTGWREVAEKALEFRGGRYRVAYFSSQTTMQAATGTHRTLSHQN
jgi:hypothetical protein